MNNYQKIMSLRPFDLIDVLARHCPTPNDMSRCLLDEYAEYNKERACRRCWGEWLSESVQTDR